VLGPPMIDALVLSLSNIVICLVAAALYVAVNELEPNRRLASTLRIVIVAVAVAAILGHLTRYPALVLATPGS
jgi:chromate transport protein ChrA